MKHFIYLFIIIFTYSSNSQEWVDISVGGEFTTNQTTIFSAKFLNSQIGCATGLQNDTKEGLVFVTRDGGISWTNFKSPNLILRDVVFLDGNNWIVVGYEQPNGINHVYLTSSDAGVTWTRNNYSSLTGPDHAYLLSNGDLITYGYGQQFGLSYGIARLPSGSTEWEIVKSGQGTPGDLSIIDNDNQFITFSVWDNSAMKLSYTISSTSDGWETANDIILESGVKANIIGMISPEIGFLGYRKDLYKTIDGCNTLNLVKSFDISIDKIKFYNEDLGFIISGGTSQYTTDGGSTWNATTLPQNVRMRNCQFSNDVMYVCGSNGNIYKMDLEAFGISPTNISDVNNEEYITINKHKIIFNNTNEISNISFYNYSGIFVNEFDSNVTSINTDSFDRGLYIIILTLNNGKTIRHKIIID